VLSNDSSTYKVLVVDDIYENRSLLVQMVQYLGFETCEADDGFAAIEQLSICKPDIIFMDIQMPRMNGFEAIEKIRSSSATPNIPIALVSANVFEEDKQKALDEGANAFIEKPIKEEDLVLTLQTLLNLKFIKASGSSAEIMQSRPEVTRLSLQQIQSVYQAAQELDTNALELLYKEYLESDPQVISYMQERLHEYQFSDILLLCETFINAKND
jgi:CheY-like chemotaxis protein